MYTYTHATMSSTSMTLWHLTNVFTHQWLQVLLCHIWEGTALCEPLVTLRFLLKLRWFPPESGNLTRPCVNHIQTDGTNLCLNLKGIISWQSHNQSIKKKKIWKHHAIIRFIQGFRLLEEELATLAHRNCELLSSEAILLAVLYTHTQMRIWLQKQRESYTKQ